MIDRIIQGWRSLKLFLALQRGNEQKSRNILQEIRRSKTQLSGLEKLFQDKLETDYKLKQKQKEIVRLKQQIKNFSQLDSFPSEFNFEETNFVIPDQNIIARITQQFNLIELDDIAVLNHYQEHDIMIYTT